ncbi:MAG: hypothetical protein KJO64_10170, partial [Bacteroidia bacterium]|nr:hypothetical protein [Bacteroidia bacterium]
TNTASYGANIAKRTQSIIYAEDKNVKQFVSVLEQELGDKNKSVHLPLLLEKLSKRAPNYFSFFVSSKDSLLYWSNSQIPYSRTLKDNAKQKFIFHKNGWYINYSKQIGDYELNGLYLIKNAYPFENKYLVNEFNPRLKIPQNFSLVRTEKGYSENYSIKDADDQTLFTVSASDNQNTGLLETSRVCFLFSVFFLFIYLIFIIKYFRNTTWWQTGIVILFISAIRFASIYFKFPLAIYSSQNFSPEHYATSFLLNSLGDLLINSLLLTLFILILYQVWRYTRVTVKARSVKPWLSVTVVIMLIITNLYVALSHYLIARLVLDSNISFDWGNIFELDSYSMIGFLVISFLLLGIYLLSDDAIRLIRKTEFKKRKILLLYAISIVLFLFTWYALQNTQVFKEYSLAPFVLTHTMLWFIFLTRKVTLHRMSFTRTLSVLLICALFTSYILNKYIEIKERDTRSSFANSLSHEQDLIAEFLFVDELQKVKVDKFVSAYFDSYNKKLQNPATVESAVSKRLLQLYFTGHWNTYDLVIHSYDKVDQEIRSPGNKQVKFTEFTAMVSDSVPLASDQNFYFINNKALRLSYLGFITINNGDSTKAGTIVIEFKSKYFKSSPGFPDLLLTKNIPRDPLNTKYSYAKYENNAIQFRTGEYPYLFSSDQYELKHGLKQNQQLFKNENKYSHLYYKPLNSSLIIVSKPLANIFDLITPFSYLFTYFCILFFIAYFIVIVIRSRFKVDLNLKNRIQISIMAIVVLSIAVLGGGTVYYIFKSYSDNQNVRVAEQVSNLSQIVEAEIREKNASVEDNAASIQNALAGLVNVNETDFNFFDRSGKLLFSTQPNIFEKNILSGLMNARAYNELEYRSGSRFMQFEKAGSLQFMSAYEPIKGLNEKVIGYINHPYFAREDELKREISTFLVALINIYVLLFSIAVLVTFFVANRITEPLRLIQRKLGLIRLGRKNELITWNKDDEIGLLVNEYNRMVQELAVSADMLAKSERETAWREMAKQVAHEIKNPLTPMKLSLQHLQRAYHDKRDDMDETIQKISRTIIEQIDTLSNIANEFSNFAQMPRAQNMTLDLNEILKNTVQLYDEAEGVDIKYDSNELEIITVNADKDHMNRVFSNLIKNAIQAIPDERSGVITVEANLNGNNRYRIKIKDNGMGIPDDKKDSIFRPNFTTKTGGTGLGLAMSKNIIEGSGGKIWFETEVNKGTTFFVELPKIS